MDEPKAHIDPLAYQQRGLSDPGALPIAQGRVVGYDPSGTRRSGSSSHGSGYSFDAVAAKIARNESPSPEDHPEGPPLNQGRQGQTPVVEIAPGVYHRLRGAAETWECVERDFYMPVSCFACAAELCCIQDASYVLCPTCRVVSRMDGMSADHDGGVGLGFTMDDLCRWQSEILAKRNHQGAGQQQQHYYQRRRASGHHTSQF